MYYARCDTHYLLFVYDTMRNDLIANSDPNNPQQNLIELTLQRSKETSLDKYSSYAADPDSGIGPRGWANPLMKFSARLDGPQFAVYRAVHKWRDALARKEDESPMYLMPQQTLMEIARLLPVDPKALHSILGSRCANVVKRSLTELFELVSTAKKEGETGPSSVDFLRGTLDDNSVAAVAQRELGKDTRPKPDLPPVEQLRTEKSQLFGDMAISSLWESSPKSAQRKDAQKLVSLPWTTYVQDAVISTAKQEAAAKAQREEPDMIPLESTPKAPSAHTLNTDNIEFTLRQGRKRKQPVQSDVEDDEGGESSLQSKPADTILLDGDADDRQVKKEAKEQRKAVRAARRAARAAEKELAQEAEGKGKGKKTPRTSKAKRMPVEEDDGDDDDAEDGEVAEEEEEETPFDYSNAQSVLHAERAKLDDQVVGKGSGRKKAFDPYAARINAEGPKPARRMHGEKAGRTHTFKK